MINKKRVRRIKNLIYAFIIMALFLPLILISILSFRIGNLEKKINEKIDSFLPSISQTATPSPDPSDDDYLMEPEDEIDGGVPIQTLEETGAGDNKSDREPASSDPTLSDNTVTPDGIQTDDIAADLDAGVLGSAAGQSVSENPLSGSNAGYNGNPLTGR